MSSKGHYTESRGNNDAKNPGIEKIRFLRDTINKEIAFNNLFNKENLDTNLFNKCNRDFVETENGRFVHNVKSEVTAFEISHLKNQNILLKQLISELSYENNQLKEKLLGAGNDQKSAK